MEHHRIGTFVHRGGAQAEALLHDAPDILQFPGEEEPALGVARGSGAAYCDSKAGESVSGSTVMDTRAEVAVGLQVGLQRGHGAALERDRLSSHLV